MELDEFLEIFSDKTTRSIFEKIVDKLRINHKDLSRILEVESTLLIEYCTKLKDLDLINETKGPIQDFSKYYVTTRGLTISRRLNYFRNVLRND